MTNIEEYQLLLINKLHQNGIVRLIYTSSVKNTFFVKNASKIFDCYQYEDARSVAYLGTGMMAESKETVVICTNGDIEYRSFCSGMTEAFYRNLNVIAITITDRIKLDYNIEIKDTVKYHKRIYGNITKSQAEEYIDKIIFAQRPCHLDIDLLENQETINTQSNIDACDPINISWLLDIIPKNSSIFVGSNFKMPLEQIDYNYSTSISGGYEGVLARTLGASLCGNKKHYVGIVTEKEFVHDINCLGNHLINDKIIFIVYINEKKDVVTNYAEALSFVCINVNEGDGLSEFPNAPLLLIVNK